MGWERVSSKYEIVETDLQIGQRQIRLAQVRDINALVDAMGPEDFGPDERLPYWAVLWSAARDLATWVERQGPLGTTIELGAGLGLGAIAAALAGAEVLATDYEEEALEFISHNASLNGVEVRVELADWRTLSQDRGKFRGFQTVIASDVLYEARQAEPLARSISHLLAEGGIAAIADPGRPHLPEFRRLLAAEGFAVQNLRIGETVLIEVRRPSFTRSSG